MVGDEAGGVSTWQVVPPPAGGAAPDARSTSSSRTRPVVGISASKRDKGFVTADAAGDVHLTTAPRADPAVAPRPAAVRAAVAFAPKADGLVTLDEAGGSRSGSSTTRTRRSRWKTLFGKVWYEGYSEPEYVWQSTGGTDDFEAKFSLTPLIFGTLKGTFYALLFAVPLALLAALYVSEFMHPTLKGYVKPVVEIMAALPSVVLGFLAGLWLAPVVERRRARALPAPARVLPSCILVALLLARGAAACGAASGRAPRSSCSCPVVLAGGWLAFALGASSRAAARRRLPRLAAVARSGSPTTSATRLVVGMAMGFAVIPIIFTIAEDSLANVPQHLRAGSLALGASRWQTAPRSCCRPRARASSRRS